MGLAGQRWMGQGGQEGIAPPKPRTKEHVKQRTSPPLLARAPQLLPPHRVLFVHPQARLLDHAPAGVLTKIHRRGFVRAPGASGRGVVDALAVHLAPPPASKVHRAVPSCKRALPLLPPLPPGALITVAVGPGEDAAAVHQPAPPLPAVRASVRKVHRVLAVGQVDVDWRKAVGRGRGRRQGRRGRGRRRRAGPVEWVHAQAGGARARRRVGEGGAVVAVRGRGSGFAAGA